MENEIIACKEDRAKKIDVRAIYRVGLNVAM